MWFHVSRTVSGCFAVLRQLSSIRCSVPDSVFHSLVVSLVMPHLDCGNATLAGLPCPSSVDFSRCSTPPPDWYIDLLSTSTSHRCCETFTGCSLWNTSISSWLFSLTDACTVWRHGILLTTSSASLIQITAVSGRRHPHSWWSDVHGCPLLAIVHFRWLEATSGTVCRQTSPQLHCFSDPPQNLSLPDHFLPNCFRFSSVHCVL